MTVGKINVGQLVCSKAGRDKKRFFLIYDILDKPFVRVIDGDTRKIDSPKKKSIKHLIFFNKVSDELAEKFRNGVRVSNADIRKAIQNLGELPES